VAIDPIVIQLLQEVDSIITGQQQQQAAQAQQATLDTVLQAANATLTQVNASLQELIAAHQDIGVVSNQVTACFAALRQLGANIPPLGTPVTLPHDPPVAWVIDIGNEVSTSVWTTVDPTTGETYGFLLSDASVTLDAWVAAGTFLPYDSPFFGYDGTFDIPPGDAPLPARPQPDPANILPSDSILSWLQRELPTWTWETNHEGTHFVGGYEVNPGESYTCLLNQGQFDALKRAATPVILRNRAPVWPGLANVTLGAALAMADGLLIPGPLDGVLVHITAVPNPISYYPFGPIKSFVRAGAVAFVDDNGQAEFPAPLGPDQEIICPKTMVRADHAYLRMPSGVIGTITPWVSNV
jgi:hypothetical protein